MRRMLLVGLLAVSLAGCVVGHDRRGSGLVVVPALPPVVVLEAEPYYQHSGYVYHYRNDRWFYSRSRSGTWLELPRDRYPKEVKFKDKGRDRGDERGQSEKRGREDSDDERGRGEKRGHDKQDRD